MVGSTGIGTTRAVTLEYEHGIPSCYICRMSASTASASYAPACMLHQGRKQSRWWVAQALGPRGR